MPPMDKVYGGESIMTTFEGSTNWEYYVSYIDDFRFEYENSDDLLEFQEWVAMEQFFGQRISKETFESLSSYYNEVDEAIDGDILDLGGDEPFIDAFRPGDTAVYYGGKDRQKCMVLGVLESDEANMILRTYESPDANVCEYGPVYMIRLGNGQEIYALYRDLAKGQKAEKESVSEEKETGKKKFQSMCYEAYKLDWMIRHGWTLHDLSEIFRGLVTEEVEEEPENIPTDEKSVNVLADCVEDRFWTESGFGSGSLYVCEEEFLGSEFLDEGYMLHLLSLMPLSEEKIAQWREITGIRKKEKPEIAKVLTLSTAHISEETRDMLDDDVLEELSEICVYPKIGMPVGMIRDASDADIREMDYGWWIYIPQDDVSPDLHELKNLPEDLFGCIKYASEHGCVWLCLDRDGDTVPSLPEYDW